MSSVLIMNGRSRRIFAGGIRESCGNRAKRSTALSFKEKSKRNIKNENGDAGLFGVGFFVVLFAVFSCAFYLFQVNDMATMGYQMRDIESTIQSLEKENKKMQIKEIELKSMHNLEKATENLGLIGYSDITYMELKGPVAMK